jgi:hypothetical protein
MREELLQFIWRFRYFNHRDLCTDAGEPLFIHHPGEPNNNQGPDFLGAHIRIGAAFCQGAVELHVCSSGWRLHGHEGDPHYAAVILHVVWENDCVDPPDGIPILTLCHRTPKILLSRYQEWMCHKKFVPCESLLVVYAPRNPSKNPVFSAAWFRELLLRRLAQRTAFIQACLASNRDNWELSTWWLIARSLGQPVNTHAFFAIARSLPLTSLLRQSGNPRTLEAILLGQAGLLDGPTADPGLRAEFQFYSAKYQLDPPGLPISFLRMRPAHSPTVRLSQLAALLTLRSGWFTLIRESNFLHELQAWLDLGPSQPKLGKTIRDSIVLNAFIPLLYAFGTLRQEPGAQKKAIRWLHETAPERNAILDRWRCLGITASNAAESQALLELQKNYCATGECLRCDIGRRLLTAPQ